MLVHIYPRAQEISDERIVGIHEYRGLWSVGILYAAGIDGAARPVHKVISRLGAGRNVHRGARLIVKYVFLRKIRFGPRQHRLFLPIRKWIVPFI